MPRSLTLGNGTILVGIDERAQVRDFYFPYVGLENHVSARNKHRVGVSASGRFHWFDDDSWRISVDCADDALVGETLAENDYLAVAVRLSSIVYNEKNIFLRRVTVTNNASEKRDIKVFFGQEFFIGETIRGDTAYFDPRVNGVIHYDGRRVFLIGALHGRKHFDEYSIGLSRIEGKEGAYKDAEDGALSGNPIEHGSVDSAVGIEVTLRPGGEETFYYWIAVGETYDDVSELNEYVILHTPEHLLQTTRDFWRAWSNRRQFSFYGLPEELIAEFKKSLLIIRAHVDRGGSIIASSDSDMLQYGRDTYSYMWPRDGALAALAMARAGDFNIARQFFVFCNEVVAQGGYFLHKYRPDRSLGSSWHPWVRDGKPDVPIQEDETALVLVSLWKFYELSYDLEFVESVYNTLIKPAADFLASHLDEKTGLPRPSYDIWEEKYGVHTFTASATSGALQAAGRFAELLGKRESAVRFHDAAERVREGIFANLYSDERKMFRKSMHVSDSGKQSYDDTLDISSFYGIIRFGLAPLGDEKIAASFATLERDLFLPAGTIGGVPRYEGDQYYKNPYSPFSNPWMITTLWLAQYYVRIAKSENDFQKVYQWLNWAVKHALPSGVLSEQLDPYTGIQLSAAPLVWSHSEFVMTVVDYLEKAEELGLCKACYPIS